VIGAPTPGSTRRPHHPRRQRPHRPAAGAATTHSGRTHRLRSARRVPVHVRGDRRDRRAHAAACRQLAARARRAITTDVSPSRFQVESAEQRLFTKQFIAACTTGDLDGLLAILDPEVDAGPTSATAPSERTLAHSQSPQGGCVTSARVPPPRCSPSPPRAKQASWRCVMAGSSPSSCSPCGQDASSKTKRSSTRSSSHQSPRHSAPASGIRPSPSYCRPRPVRACELGVIVAIRRNWVASFRKAGSKRRAPEPWCTLHRMCTGGVSGIDTP
jgi:hypothetical protein